MAVKDVLACYHVLMYFCYMINSGIIHKIVDQLSSITWVAEDGSIVRVPHCKFSSWHGNGDTFNIFIPVSGQVRTVNRNTIIEFNGEEVIL